MISKELLSEVLGNKVESIRLVEKYDGRIGGRVNDLHITFEDYVENINIYEIAYRCKEWAILKGYELHSAWTDVNEAYLELYSKYLEERKFTTETETEAIFKACQWILGNKENDDKAHTN